jgi:hypothetical protein
MVLPYLGFSLHLSVFKVSVILRIQRFALGKKLLEIDNSGQNILIFDSMQYIFNTWPATTNLYFYT